MRHLRWPASLSMLLMLAATMALSASASATAIYRYTGFPYSTVVDTGFVPGTYDESMSLEIEIELSDALQAPGSYQLGDTLEVLSFFATDGRVTLTQENATIGGLLGGSSAAITSWLVAIEGTHPSAEGELDVLFVSATEPLYRDQATLTLISSESYPDEAFAPPNLLGWTLVPEPSVASLVAGGLALLALRASRSDRKAARGPS